MGNQSVDALVDVSFSAEKGEFISILGPSGSGKTSRMKIIGCLGTPTAGAY